MCRKKTNEEFIKESNIIHNFKYDYSLTNYKGSRRKVKIICPIHGEFTQRADLHAKYGYGCRKCGINSYTKDTNQFIRDSMKIHGDIYDYSSVNYKNNYTKVDIKCNKHGIFSQKPNSHLIGKGCPSCKRSKGEIKISKWLDINNVDYIEQKTFENLKYKDKLRCDFYLPNYNLVIEYNGIQHYESIEHFGGDKGLEITKMRDKIKSEYFKNNKIGILTIKYSDFNNINTILESKIKSFLI